MGIEQRINYQLNRFPAIKKVVKRCYQLAMYSISRKIKSEGEIVRVSPNDECEYFFGYYDKSPWDAENRRMICMRAENTWKDVAPKESADILIIDTQRNNSVTKVATTHSWNVQQGCMAQWLGPDYNSSIIYNDFRKGSYCSVILNLETNEEKVINIPVYSVSEDGKTALSLDFSRLHRLRKGYGYSNLPDMTRNEKIPVGTCIWKVNLETGECMNLMKYTDFSNFEPRPEMKDAVHKVNHIMISPDGERFMVLHRWFDGNRKYTRLVTCDINGADMYNLSDDDMVSHCCWKNDEEILAFENKKNGGTGYYLMKDKTDKFTHFWKQLSNDGHPTYSPDKKLIVTDSYPDRARIANIKLLKENREDFKVIARVFAPFKYDNDTRCDLHPRWDRSGNKICFDSVFEGKRGLYQIDLNNNKEGNVR